MVTIRSLFLLCGLFHRSTFDLAFAYSNGAGDCPQGKAAVGGPHLTQAKVITGTLAKAKYNVMIAGVGVTNKKTAYPPGLEFNIRIKGPSFKGVLIRVAGATSSQVTPGPGLKVASVCKDVGGVTHSSSSDKKEAFATVKLSKPAYLKVDVTVVVKNANGVSEYYYSTFNVDARGVKVGETICVEGYPMDLRTITSNALCDTPKVPALENPGKYTIHCLADVQASIDSGYELLTDPPKGQTRYKRGWRLADSSSERLVEMARRIGLCNTCGPTGTVKQGMRVAMNATVFALATDDSVPLIYMTYMEYLMDGEKRCNGLTGSPANWPKSAPLPPPPADAPSN